MLQTRDKNAPPLTIICHEGERERGMKTISFVSDALALNRNRRIEFLSIGDPGIQDAMRATRIRSSMYFTSIN